MQLTLKSSWVVICALSFLGIARNAEAANYCPMLYNEQIKQCEDDNISCKAAGGTTCAADFKACKQEALYDYQHCTGGSNPCTSPPPICGASVGRKTDWLLHPVMINLQLDSLPARETHASGNSKTLKNQPTILIY